MKKYIRPNLVKVNVDKELCLVMLSAPPTDPNGSQPNSPLPGIVGKAIRILIR
ncbi:MAG: hypothetical protein RL762_131 [Bacteroidota bacterium]|jgi:hypothetical protein